MGIINPPLPTAGEPRGSGEVDVIGALTTILGLVNGSIDAANLDASVKPASLLASYKTFGRAAGWLGAANLTAAGVYAPTIQGFVVLDNVADTNVPLLLDLDPADFVVSGVTPRLRVRASIVTNAIAPGRTFTCGLYPVSPGGGAASQVAVNLGAVVASSTVVLSPGASDLRRGASADFAVPAAGLYVLAFSIAGALTANSGADLAIALQHHHV